MTMTNENAHIRYKRGTRFLVNWMINTSSGAIRGRSVADNDGNPLQPTTTGHITISTTLAMARRIAHFEQSTPSIIFRSVTEVRRPNQDFILRTVPFFSDVAVGS